MAVINHDDPDIATFFRRFVGEAGSSPLYVAMCPLLADSVSAVALYDGVGPMQRRPNLLFAAIHHSLLRDPGHPLAQWYATVGGSRSPSDDALAGVLDAFLADRRAELAGLVADGATQTNEVGRSAILLPALGLIHATERRPLGLVEVGTSGALNLRLDAYRVSYRTAPEQDPQELHVGPPDSSVHITSDASRSREQIPAAEIRSTVIGSRVGSDLNPLDVSDEAQARWLRALIWPDERERFERLSNALVLARSIPVPVRRGDAVDLVRAQITSVPDGHHPVLLTTWVLTYLPEKKRVAFVDELAKAGEGRAFSWVCVEHPSYCRGIPWPEEVTRAWNAKGGADTLDAPVSGNPVVVHRFENGKRTSRWIATVHPHGRWINWHPSSATASLP